MLEVVALLANFVETLLELSVLLVDNVEEFMTTPLGTYSVFR